MEKIKIAYHSGINLEQAGDFFNKVFEFFKEVQMKTFDLNGRLADAEKTAIKNTISTYLVKVLIPLRAEPVVVKQFNELTDKQENLFIKIGNLQQEMVAYISSLNRQTFV